MGRTGWLAELNRMLGVGFTVKVSKGLKRVRTSAKWVPGARASQARASQAARAKALR